MPTVSRAFELTTPPEVVLPFLADFANAEQWDPGTVSCTREDAGPVQVGSRWHNTSKLAGISTELTYTLKEQTATKLVLVGVNKTATSIETIVVEPKGSGSTLTYRNDLTFNGPAKLASPLAKLLFEKVANDTQRQMTEVLNGLASPSVPR